MCTPARGLLCSNGGSRGKFVATSPNEYIAAAGNGILPLPKGGARWLQFQPESGEKSTEWCRVREPGCVDRIAYDHRSRLFVVAGSAIGERSEGSLESESPPERHSFVELYELPHGARQHRFALAFAHCECLEILPGGRQIASVFHTINSWTLYLWSNVVDGTASSWSCQDFLVPNCMTPLRHLRFPDDEPDVSRLSFVSTEFLAFGRGRKPLIFWRQQDSIHGCTLMHEAAKFLGYGGRQRDVRSGVRLARDVWLTNSDVGEGSFLLWRSGRLIARIFSGSVLTVKETAAGNACPPFHASDLIVFERVDQRMIVAAGISSSVACFHIWEASTFMDLIPPYMSGDSADVKDLCCGPPLFSLEPSKEQGSPVPAVPVRLFPSFGEDNIAITDLVVCWSDGDICDMKVEGGAWSTACHGHVDIIGLSFTESSPQRGDPPILVSVGAEGKLLLWDVERLRLLISATLIGSENVTPTCAEFLPEVLPSANGGCKSLLVGDTRGCLRFLALNLREASLMEMDVVRFSDAACASISICGDGQVCVAMAVTNTCFVLRCSPGVSIGAKGVKAFTPLYCLDLRRIFDVRRVRALLVSAHGCPDYAKTSLCLWSEQIPGVLTQLDLAAGARAREDTYYLGAESCRIKMIRIALMDDVTSDCDMYPGMAKRDKRAASAKILCASEDREHLGFLWCLCARMNSEDPWCGLVLVNLVDGCVIRRFFIDSRAVPIAGLLACRGGGHEDAKSVEVLLSFADGRIRISRVSLTEDDFVENCLGDFSLHRFGSGSAKVVGSFASGGASYFVTGDSSGSLLVSRFDWSLKAERVSDEDAELPSLPSVVTIDAAASYDLPTLEQVKKSSAEAKRVELAEAVKYEKRLRISEMRREVAALKALNSKMPTTLRLPVTTFQSCMGVFCDVDEAASNEMDEIARKWDPILKAVKIYEEKLQYFFLARWQWDEINAKIDFSEEPKRLEVTTWRIEKLPAGIYASLNEAFDEIGRADEIYSRLGFVGRDARFRSFLANACGYADACKQLRSEDEGRGDGVVQGVKCCATLFPGDLTVSKKRGEWFAARVALVDYASDFNRKVVDLTERVTTGRKAFAELEEHYEVLTGESADLSLAQVVARSRVDGGAGFLDAWLRSLPAAVLVPGGSFESSRSAVTSDSPSYVEDTAVAIASEAEPSDSADRELSALEERILRERHSDLIKNVRQVVHEAVELLERLENEIRSVRAEKIVRSVCKEWGKVRCLELSNQVAALEPMADEERAILNAVRVAWESVAGAKEEFGAAAAAVNEKLEAVEAENKRLAELDEEAEAALFAFPRHHEALRAIYRRGTLASESAPAGSSEATSRNSFQRPSWRQPTSSVSSSSCPGVEEVRELGLRRAAAESRLSAATAAREEADGVRRAAAEALSRAEAELDAALASHRRLTAGKMAALSGTALTVVLTTDGARNLIDLVLASVWDAWRGGELGFGRGDEAATDAAPFGAVVVPVHSLTRMRRRLVEARAELEDKSAALASAKESLSAAAKAGQKLKEKLKKLCSIRDEWTSKKFGRLVTLPALEKHLKGRRVGNVCGRVESESTGQKARRRLEAQIKDLEAELIAVTRENTRRKERLRKLQEKNREVEAKLCERRKHLAWQARQGQLNRGRDFLHETTRKLLYRVEAQASYIDQLQLQILAFKSKAIPAPRPLGTAFDLF